MVDSPSIEVPLLGTISTRQYVVLIVSIMGLLKATVIFYNIRTLANRDYENK